VDSGVSTGKSAKVDLSPYRTFIQELARESGDFIRPLYRHGSVAVEFKADQSPVTEADRGAEELMRARIAQRFPQHGIIGEEFGSERADAEFVWVLDPVDGTKSFITGVPLWGTLIALLHRGQPVLGCIHQPILNQLMLGDGRETTLNDRPVRCRATTRIEDSTLLTSEPGQVSKWDRLRCLAAPRQTRAHVGRLLRILPGRERLGRHLCRSHHEPVGHRRARPDYPRIRWHHQRLERRRGVSRRINRRRCHARITRARNHGAR